MLEDAWRNVCWFFLNFIFMGEKLEKSQKKTARITPRLRKISHLKIFKGVAGFVHQKEENERECYKHGSTSTRRREKNFNLRKKGRIRSSTWKLKSGKLKVGKGLILFFFFQTKNNNYWDGLLIVGMGFFPHLEGSSTQGSGGENSGRKIPKFVRILNESF